MFWKVWEALSNLELFPGKYVKPGDPDETSLPPEQSNFTPSVSKLLSFTQADILEFRPEDSSHVEKHGVSAAFMEAEHCVVDIESSNNERWSSDNFPWAKELEELGKKLYVNFSLEPEQREVINATMIGHDVFAEMPAGLGSRVTYELLARLCPGMTVVVVPFAPVVAVRVEDPVPGRKSMGLSDLMKLTEQQRTLGELVTERCEFKLVYVTADDTITQSKLLLEHLKTLYDRELLTRIFIEDVESGLGIFKQKFPSVPLVALASIPTDCGRDEVVNILGLVNYIHFKKRRIHSRVSSSKQSKQGKCEPTSSKCSLTIEKCYGLESVQIVMHK
ncbi:ATP-dependent DNA helicase Q-like 4B [Coffea eugenioides]|uniref:ATP-dependent DNA helicase Q-like 4B n=1 Tax=Coffea eugenioides TaxID=49369 RepID=UPI000F60F0E4|nr:ATP-dependent DNA helicase Q-like 4B [Coffea eugenioides]